MRILPIYSMEKHVVTLKLSEERSNVPLKKIAIVTALSMTDRDTSNVKNFQFYKNFLQSFCKTASNGYKYTIYVGFDFNDIFMRSNYKVEKFKKIFRLHLKRECSDKKVMFVMLKFRFHKKPSWIQNDLMVKAYLDGNEYFFKLHDDIILKTQKWTEKFISQLLIFNPKNLGVVGPRVENEKEHSRVIQFEFVHRTHFHIFGYFYPREFSGWFADDWVSRAYQSDNAVILKDVTLINKWTNVRYDKVESNIQILDNLVETAQWKIKNFKKYSNFPLSIKFTPKKVAVLFYHEEVSYPDDYSIILNSDIEKKLYLSSFEKQSSNMLTNSNQTFINIENKASTEEQILQAVFQADNTNLDIVHLRSHSSPLSYIDNSLINEMNSEDLVCQLYYDSANNEMKNIEILSLNLPKILELHPNIRKDLFKNFLYLKPKLIKLLASECVVYTKCYPNRAELKFKSVKCNPAYRHLFPQKEIFPIHTEIFWKSVAIILAIFIVLFGLLCIEKNFAYIQNKILKC